MTSEASQTEPLKLNEGPRTPLERNLLSKKIIKGYQGKAIVLKKQDLNLELLKPIRVKRLEVKSVSFRETHLSLGDMKMLGEMIKSMRKMENLSFNFERKNKVTDRSLGEIWKRFRVLRGLRSIKFSLDRCEEITNEGIQNLCESLKKVRRLRNLHINFLDWMTYGKLDLVGINEINSTLKSLKCLKDLRLCFRDGRYVYLNMGLENLERSFRVQSSLESLYLDFGIISKLDCVSLCRILERLKRNRGLRNFALDFAKFSVVNDGVLEALSQVLSEFIHLESLSLRFYKCPDITNKRMEVLSQALKPLTGLKSLALNFQECGRIDDSGVKVICQGLGSIINLRRIKLQFTQCAGITDETIGNLAKSLSYSPQLESINVTLTGCPKISLPAKESFQRSLDALSYIKNKTISF